MYYYSNCCLIEGGRLPGLRKLKILKKHLKLVLVFSLSGEDGCGRVSSRDGMFKMKCAVLCAVMVAGVSPL